MTTAIAISPVLIAFTAYTNNYIFESSYKGVSDVSEPVNVGTRAIRSTEWCELTNGVSDQVALYKRGYHV